MVVPVMKAGAMVGLQRIYADGEKLFARGSADMKGFVASMLATVPEMQARGLKRPPVVLSRS